MGSEAVGELAWETDTRVGSRLGGTGRERGEQRLHSLDRRGYEVDNREAEECWWALPWL